jgi:hypothetical protein
MVFLEASEKIELGRKIGGYPPDDAKQIPP